MPKCVTVIDFMVVLVVQDNQKMIPKEQPAGSTFGRVGFLWAVLGAKVAKGSAGEGEEGKASERNRKGDKRGPVKIPAPGRTGSPRLKRVHRPGPSWGFLLCKL